jgi:hypothetical protein
MYKECKSHLDQSECVASLGNKCRQVLSSFTFDEKDTRRVTLDNVEKIARGGQMILNLLNSWCIGGVAVKQIIPQLVGLETVSEVGVKNAGGALNISSRLSLVVLGQFQIEYCLRNITEELNLPSGGTGFYRTAKNLTQHLSCPSNMLDELNVPALIRNSLHGNGIHHGFQGNNTTTHIAPVTYEFIHNIPVNCASWEHIAHALENSIEILQHILSTNQVSAITKPIIDQYAGSQ